MLINVETGSTITKMPHASQHRAWMSRLTLLQIAAAKAALDSMIDSDEIHTAGWMAGNDWNGTPFALLYTKATRCDRQASGLCFGLLV